jgi:hypothetical protein
MKHIRTTLPLVVLAMLAMTASASQSHRHKFIKPQPVPRRVAAPVIAPQEVRPMVGTWTMRDGDKPRGDIRMVFRPNGTFAFVGPNWQSAGVFKLRDHKLALEWTMVDGSRVAPGTIKKAYPMTEDDASFTIDKYTYFKLHN